MSRAEAVAVARLLMQRAEAAGLRLVPCGDGFGLAIVGDGGQTVGEPLPVRDPEHAAFVIGACGAVRAELLTLGAIHAARERAQRTSP
jgi:hypothetical protein